MTSPKSTKDTAEKIMKALVKESRYQFNLKWMEAMSVWVPPLAWFTIGFRATRLKILGDRARRLLASKRVNKKKVVADFLAGKRSSRGIEDIIRRVSKRGKKRGRG